MSAAANLRRRLAAPDILVAPGVYDALSAHLAAEAGFEAVFVSGSALAAAQLARPDLGLFTLTETAEVVGRIADRVAVPLFVDADQGFGNAAMTARAVRLLEKAGAACIQIEDQAETKPEDALLGRPLIATRRMVDKIGAAKDALAGETLLSARSDAMASEGFEAALGRVHAYVEAGADMVFVEGLTRRAQMERLVAELGARVPLLHNLLRAKGAPRDEVTGAADLEALGYRVALFPAVGLTAASEALAAAFAGLAATPELPGGQAVAPDRIGGAAFIARYTSG